METITTYLNSSFTTYEMLAMLVVAFWLIFNAGFVAGAAWKATRPRQNIDIENTTIRCRLRSPDDIDGLQDVARRIGA